ncbi:MAG: hypothetical protein WCO57_02940 [Verrucomicrobiota bacterium]
MTREPDLGEGTPALLAGCGMLAATLLANACGLLLVWFAVLRESLVFWTNAGGYPIWLRDLVQWTYLPLWVGTVVLLGSLSVACLAKIGGGLRFFMLESVLLLLGWVIVSTSGFVAFQNNIGNLLNGHPIHYHKE